MKIKTAEEIGIKASNIRLPSSTTEHEVLCRCGTYETAVKNLFETMYDSSLFYGL